MLLEGQSADTSKGNQDSGFKLDDEGGKTANSASERASLDSNAHSSDASASSTAHQGKFANTGMSTESLRQIVYEETKYLDRLSRRIEALIESQEKLSRRIELYIRALGIFPSLGRGMAVGFGLVIGSTVIVGLFVYILTRAETIPLIGDFVKRVIDYINVEQLSR